jgi:hypothetical protein
MLAHKACPEAQKVATQTLGLQNQTDLHDDKL